VGILILDPDPGQIKMDSKLELRSPKSKSEWQFVTKYPGELYMKMFRK